MTQPRGPDEVYQGEKVLWRGKPRRYLFVEPADGLIMVVGAGWIALLLRSPIGGENPPELFVAWNFLLLAVGAATTLGHPLVRAVRLRSTGYTVTSRRVVTRTDLIRTRTDAEFHLDLDPPVLREHADGGGTIGFGKLPGPLVPFRSLSRHSSMNHGRRPPVILREIGQARQVYDLIAAARDRAGRGEARA